MLNVAGNNRTYLGLHVQCSIFFTRNQIWVFSTDIHVSPQYQISRISLQWEPLRYMRTNGRTWRR